MTRDNKISIYAGIKNISYKNIKDSSIFIESNIEDINEFSSKASKFNKNIECEYVQGYLDENNEDNVTFYQYSDNRFDGLRDYEYWEKIYPNIKLLNEKPISTINIEKILESSKIKINDLTLVELNISAGNPNAIFSGFGRYGNKIYSINISGASRFFIKKEKLNRNLSLLEFKLKDNNQFIYQWQKDKNDLRVKLAEKILEGNKAKLEEQNLLISKYKKINKMIFESQQTSSRKEKLKLELRKAKTENNIVVTKALSFYLNKFEKIDINDSFLEETSLISEGADAALIKSGSYVVKIYSEKYFSLKHEFRRNHEPIFLNSHNSKFLPKVKYFGETYMVLDYLGDAIGTQFDRPGELILINGNTIVSAIKWLSELGIYLKKNEIFHGDITFSNILYDNLHNKFNLIDFTWAKSKYLNKSNWRENEREMPNAFKIRHPGFDEYGKIDDQQTIKILTKTLIEKLITEYKRTWGSLKIIPGIKEIEIDEDLRFYGKKRNLDEFTRLVLEQLKSNPELVLLDINPSFTAFPIICSYFGKKVYVITSEIESYRVYQAFKFRSNLRNLNIYHENLTKYTLGNIVKDKFIACLSNPFIWENKFRLNNRFDKFMQELHKYSDEIFIPYYKDFQGNKEFIKSYIISIGFKEVEEISSDTNLDIIILRGKTRKKLI